MIETLFKNVNQVKLHANQMIKKSDKKSQKI